jgi:hypothetical protein
VKDQQVQAARNCLDETINRAVQDGLIKLINTAFSVKFWFCLAVLIAGLVRGGPEGYGAALAAVAVYTGAKTYQNVQMAKLNGSKK